VSKLLFLSTCIMMVVIPVLASKLRSPRKGLKLAILAVLAFHAFYLVAVLGYQLRLNWKMSPAVAMPEFFSR